MMRKYFAILCILTLLIPLILSGTFQLSDTLAQEFEASHKISGLLAAQVKGKLRAIEAGGVQIALEASSNEGLVDILQSAGILVDDPGNQRIFIYLIQEPDQTQVAELGAMGITVYMDSWIPPVSDHPAGFVLADMPIDKLEELALKGYVIRLDTAERVLEAQNDLATEKINADDVWLLGYDGTGVTIAVLDSGLDVNSAGDTSHHPDIPNPTQSKDYDDYPTLDDDIRNTVTGHGTHVTGSALGQGTQSSGVYKGSAPDADLIFLKIGNDTTGGASTAAIVGAIKDAVDTYNADIITMSYGGWDAYHDGTSQEAQAVDYAVSNGAVVFISAGNSGNDDEHYSGTVAASDSSGFIQVDIAGDTGSDTGLAYNLVWYDGTSTSNDLELEYYNSSFALLASTNLTQSESSRGTESEYSSGDSYVTNGTFYLKVKNNSANSQFFHLYYDPYYNLSGAGNATFASPDPYYTIGSPADADSAIAIGSYTTRKYWWDYKDGGSWSYTSNETVDQISTFSSLGPRVDSGTSPKPDIVAPGSAIISTRDDDVLPLPSSGPPSTYAPFIDNDGPNRSNATGGSNDGNGPADYYVMQGTSMAAPHAAGVAALIVEKNPTWTPAQVKHTLESTATDKGATGSDDIYGWGLINALAAVNSSLPVTDAFSDAGHTTVYQTENTVYMYTTGLLPSYTYRMAYYDGSGSKRVTEDATSDASGNLSTQHTFVDGVDIAGTWNVIVCDQNHTPPGTFSATWAYLVSQDSFTVQESAIPEFPTVLAAIVALALSAGVYLWMRRKAIPITA